MSGKARVWTTVLLTVAVLGAPGRGHLAPEGPRMDPPQVGGPQEVEVIAVLVDEHTNQPTVLLQGKRDRRALAMAIGLAEATGIAVPLHGVVPPRPLTHDLFLTLFGRLKVALTRVVITDLREDVYYATVYLKSDDAELQFDARPSDAIALALRAKVPVLVEDRVFDLGAGSPVAPRRPQI